jgi:hypothetical protein
MQMDERHHMIFLYLQEKDSLNQRTFPKCIHKHFMKNLPFFHMHFFWGPKLFALMLVGEKNRVNSLEHKHFVEWQHQPSLSDLVPMTSLVPFRMNLSSSSYWTWFRHKDWIIFLCALQEFFFHLSTYYSPNYPIQKKSPPTLLLYPC